jgi:hypothetical protein
MQWSLYKQHTSERYYEEWLLFFQRQPRKVIRCVGCVSGDPCPWGGHDVDMGAEPSHVKAALAVLQMDHSIPKRAICTQWRRLVEAHRTAHSAAETTPHFGHGVDISFVNYLLFSVADDPEWGPAMVRPRCLAAVGQRWNCHKGELEHCMAIGLNDFSQVQLNGSRCGSCGNCSLVCFCCCSKVQEKCALVPRGIRLRPMPAAWLASGGSTGSGCPCSRAHDAIDLTTEEEEDAPEAA